MADIYLTRGDARDFRVKIVTPAGAGVSVVGWTATFALCANIIGQEPLILWTSAGNPDTDHPEKFDVGVEDPEHVVIKLDDSDTAALLPGWYAWDLKLVDPLNDPFHPIAGYVYVGDTQVT